MQGAREAGAAYELANSLPGANVLDDKVHWGKDTQLANKVQLSAYPDCIGGDLQHLNVRATLSRDGH
jgi:hypothetical protein